MWLRVGEWFADVNVVIRVRWGYGVGGVMAWAGISYGQQTQLRFIDGILNTLRYLDEILKTIVHPPPSPHVLA